MSLSSMNPWLLLVLGGVFAIYVLPKLRAAIGR